MNPLDIADSAAARYSTQRLELPQGLRGEVLTDGESMGGLRDRLPSVAACRHLFEQVVLDPSVLPGYATLKYSKSGEVFRATVAETGEPTHRNLHVVCRVHHGEAFCTPWTVWRPSRARRNFHRAMALLRAGIDTARPLAWIERPSAPRTSWLVTEYVAEVVDLDQIALTLRPQMDQAEAHHAKSRLTNVVVELLARLRSTGLHHRDLKASNILITNWEGRDAPPRAMLVDLDGLQPRRWWNYRQRLQPLVRLGASLVSSPSLSTTDFVRFLRRYLGRTDTPEGDWRTLFRTLTHRAANYAQKSQLRKTHKLDGFTGG